MTALDCKFRIEFGDVWITSFITADVGMIYHLHISHI